MNKTTMLGGRLSTHEQDSPLSRYEDAGGGARRGRAVARAVRRSRSDPALCLPVGCAHQRVIKFADHFAQPLYPRADRLPGSVSWLVTLTPKLQHGVDDSILGFKNSVSWSFF